MAVDWNSLQNKWQQKWKEAELGKAMVKKNKEKFMMIFAYPGISGYLHVGHMRGYSYTDAICRYERLKGKEVLFPVGTHASGNQALAFANKVKKKDGDWMEYLERNGCSPETIATLTEPKKVIDFFNQVYVNDYWKKFGFLCDWDRFTCTTYPDYEKFIQWQFQKLLQKNLLVQKPYFATACINCGPVAVDASETDISKGENAEKQEFTLLKFKLDAGIISNGVGDGDSGNESEENYLVAATLRPETVYGQTNLWINPDVKYVRVGVEGENWVMSPEAAEKLAFQKDDVLLKEDIDPKKLLGKKARAPGIEREVIILPATFCDPKVGTGIVTSVPSDAPYDYIALKFLQEHPEECRKYGINSEEVVNLGLIPIIKTPGYGDFPARELCQKFGIHSLDDPKLEEATKEVYKVGYHTGVMRETCREYAGKKVEEAKELIKARLLEEGKADVFHELSEEVLCRCGGKVVIKRIDDQWFIKYSDSELKERSKEQAKEMAIYPKEYYDNINGVIDWFGDRACARLGNWAGSKLPFDPKWTIEPISDSTLYPAYYIVSKFVNNGTLKSEELTEEFFDYVFMGKSKNGEGKSGEGKSGDGKSSELGKRALSESWKIIREEFEYFYPLNLNLGGKEHQTVHFPVFLMNHVAILPEEKWPLGIFVNWWVIGSGSKISKSKGGAEPIPQAIEKFGVDALRLYYAHIGSPHVDVIWTEETVFSYRNALERIYSLAENLREIKSKPGRQKSFIDEWLLSRVHAHLRQIEKAMKEYDLRELASIVYFGFHDELRWYLRRGGEHAGTITEVMNVWCRLMNPITPHLSEELNELGGYVKSTAGLVSVSSWPVTEEKKINLKAEVGEELVRGTLEGMRNVLKLAKIDAPKKYTLFVAENWLYQLFETISAEIKVTHNLGELMRRVLAVEELEMKGKEISKIVPSLLKDTSKIPILVISQDEELKAMKEAREFLEKEFNCKVEIVLAEESEHPKAKSALPGKVGILVE